MQRLLIILAIMALPALSLAAGDSNHGKFTVYGFYGLGIISPTDVNNIQRNFTPRPSDISGATDFGGGLGIMLSPKIEVAAEYQSRNAKNLNGSTGIELNSNIIWGDVNYNFIRSGSMRVYAGVGLGYPIYSHVTSTLSGTKTELDADKTLAYEGQAGLGFMLGRHVQLFFQGAYQSIVSGDVKTAAGVALTTSTGSKAKVDLSGFQGTAGLGFVF